MQFLSHFEIPKVLEIGTERGQTTLPLCHNLTLLGRPFLYDGVDIVIRPELSHSLGAMAGIFLKDFEPGRRMYNIRLFEENSLDFLPKLIKDSAKYNLILLDGDHNYHSVYNELIMLDKLTLPSTLIVCDDYNTHWSDKDLFYSEREEYRGVQSATPKTIEKKSGVRPAIEDFVENTEGKWAIASASTATWGPDARPSDYCILYQPQAVLDVNMFLPPGLWTMNSQIMEVYFNKQECPEVRQNLMKNLEYAYSREGDK